jgi:hypothetical protein
MPRLLTILPLILLGTFVGAAADFDQSHAAFDAVLKRYVKNGRVDYRDLKADRGPLDGYLDQLASVPVPSFKQWSQPQQLAFLINAYNAFTLGLILDHYPVKSIKGTGSILHGPWEQPVVRLFGTTTTLDYIEHKLLRKNYDEPRIHFAIVCAAKSCPPLRSEAYQATRLYGQLDDQARKFLADPAKNRVNETEHVVDLSPIFKWYAGDFEKKAGTVLAFLKPYWPKSVQALLDRAEFKVRYTEYDWSLNEAATVPAAQLETPKLENAFR